MINREDMLELTRRMTPSRTCFDRIAGAYIDAWGEIEDTFNIHFGKLSGSEKARNLNLAKTVPFSKTNVELKEYTFGKMAKGQGSMHQLLYAIQECGLKNDDLMDVFYEQIADGYPSDDPIFGFLYPAFSNRSSDRDKIDIYHKNPTVIEEGILYKLFGRGGY